MKALLKIPFDKKDIAKSIAKEHRCALFFEPISKNWEFRGSQIPEQLKNYVIASSVMDDDDQLIEGGGEEFDPFTGETKKTVASKKIEAVVDFNQKKINHDKTIVASKQKSSITQYFDDVKSNKIFKKTSLNITPNNAVSKAKRIFTQDSSPYYNFAVDMPFNLRDSIGNYGGSYNSQYKTYIVRTNQIHKDLEQYLSQPYSYEAYIERKINDNLVRSQILGAYPKQDIIVARDYQLAAEKQIINAYNKDLGGFLLADEVGLGKTISAGVSAQHKDFETILVVTTLSAVAHWRKTFLKMTFPNKEILIINYDRLQKLFVAQDEMYKNKAKSKRAKNKRLASKGIAPKFDLVIWDESHKLRNNTSMRSKLAQKISTEASFNLYLSATAGQNPLELSYLSILLAKITGQNVRSMVDFEKWCKAMDLGVRRAEFGKWVWDGDDESIAKIHNLLFKSKPMAALRRSPIDIEGYPEISRDLTPLELTSDERSSYNLLWAEFKKAMADELENKQKGNKKTDKESNQLVAKLRLRQKASLLKVPHTIDYIEDLLENGHQVAVSVAFKETMFEIQTRLMKSKIPVALIHGGLGAREKESERMKFQRGEAQVVLFTVEEAISLHQGEYNNVPRSMLIHDLRWSAISMSQIEGRTHRDGKFSQIYWLYFIDTVEEEIAQIVLKRVISMKGMIGDDTKVLKEIEALLLASIKNNV